MKISERLHRAADERLWDGEAPYFRVSQDVWRYSCDAIGVSNDAVKARNFVKNMGVCVASASEFDEFPTVAERQGARYLWLKFAALVAESEGL